FPLAGELRVHPADDLQLLIGAGDKDHAVGLETLPLAAGQYTLVFTGLVDEHPAQAVAGRAALAVAEFDEPALATEHLGRQLPAVLAGHRPLDALDDGGGGAAVVVELLGAIMHLDAGPLAQVLVVGALVGVLEPAL